MLICRALNNYDQVTVDKKFGIINQKDLFDELYPGYLCCLHGIRDMEGVEQLNYFNCFKKGELSFLAGITDGCCVKARNRIKYIREKLENISNLNEYEKEFFVSQIADILSTINSHTVSGSKTVTNWISFTTDLEALKKYYNSQEINEVAIIDSNIEGLYDDYYLAVDMSNKEKIQENIENGILFNKEKYERTGLLEKTDINSHPVNFAAKSKEILYYSYVPQEKILNVIGPLELDLILNGLYTYDLKISQAYLNNKFYFLKTRACSIIMASESFNPIEEYILYEHYLDNKSLNKLALEKNITKEELIRIKQNILEKFSKYDTPISHKGPCKKLIMEK